MTGDTGQHEAAVVDVADNVVVVVVVVVVVILTSLRISITVVHTNRTTTP